MLLIIYISRIRVVLQNSYRIPVSEQQIAPICSMTDTCRFYYSYFIFEVEIHSSTTIATLHEDNITGYTCRNNTYIRGRM